MICSESLSLRIPQAMFEDRHHWPFLTRPHDPCESLEARSNRSHKFATPCVDSEFSTRLRISRLTVGVASPCDRRIGSARKRGHFLNVRRIAQSFWSRVSFGFREITDRSGLMISTVLNKAIIAIYRYNAAEWRSRAQGPAARNPQSSGGFPEKSPSIVKLGACIGE
jgi:hypothetical protein